MKRYTHYNTYALGDQRKTDLAFGFNFLAFFCSSQFQLIYVNVNLHRMLPRSLILSIGKQNKQNRVSHKTPQEEAEIQNIKTREYTHLYNAHDIQKRPQKSFETDNKPQS